MGARYCKTDAGRAEIKLRSLQLSRPARNLLLIVDTSRDAQAWLGLVQGADRRDLDGLLSHGLIAAAPAPDPEPPAGPAAAPAGAAASAAAVQALGDDAAAEVLAALGRLAYSALYDLLTAQARSRLGLIKGYRLVLEIERCSDLAALQTLAARFVAQLRESQGNAGLEPLRKALDDAAGASGGA